MRIMALVAAVLPMLMLSSCDDDEEIKPIEPKEEEKEFSPDEAYIHGSWMVYDSTGTMVDTKYGRILDESTPTVRSMGMDDLQEAKEHFMNVLCPPNVKVSEDGDDMTASLKDTLGVEQNKLIFKAVNDGSILARVTLEKPIGIEKILTELDYCPKSSDIYSAIDNNCPFHEGRIYYHNGHNYLCIRTPANGNYGILVSDVNKYQIIETNTEAGSTKATANYPDTGVFAEIQKILKDENSPELWQRLAATTSAQSPHSTDEVKFGVSSVPEFKGRIYWTSVTPNDNEDIVTWSLVKGNCGDVEPGYWIDDTYRWVLSAYSFSFSQTWIQKMMGLPGSWHIYRLATPYVNYTQYATDWNPSIDSFERNELVEQNVGQIKLQ